MTSVYTTRPTVAEISLDNLAYNFHSVKAFAGGDVGFMAVVKADAYGHGAVRCAVRLEDEGVDWFGVATLEEGIELREARVTKPILVLGGFWPGQESSLLSFDLTPTIFRMDQARWIAEAARTHGTVAKVHVKIDTGMGRIGVRVEEIDTFVGELSAIDGLEVDGLMTHFAAADDLSATDFTNHQISAFQSAVQTFLAYGHTPKYIDLANSPAAIVHPLSLGNLIRVGGLLYGLGGDVLPHGVPQPELRPVMSIRSKIAQIKTIKAGESIGYGRTWISERNSVVATIPIGYHDGLPRTLSNEGNLLVNGRLAPIIGRISMDWTTIDVTDIRDASVGDEVTILGESGDEAMLAEDFAALVGTISYEITCGISQRIPRQY